MIMIRVNLPKSVAVDEAWRKWRLDRSPPTETAYDEALAAWKAIDTDRGVGRPASGDRPLGSTDRAQAVRTRRQKAAEQWVKTIPLIQQLRRAVEMNNGPSITRIAGALVQATEVAFKDLCIVHVRPDQETVGIAGSQNGQPILIVVAKSIVEDHFNRRALTAKEANLIVDRNLQSFGRIAAAKYEGGDYRLLAYGGAIIPCIELVFADIEASGEMMSDR
jgi:hypothetical protein